MSRGTSLQTRLSSAFRTLNGTAHVVKFRTTTRSGGDALLGIGETVDIVDTTVNPQPMVKRVEAEEIAASGGLLQPGDFRLLFAGSVDETVLKTSQILYGDDVLQVSKIEETVLYGTVLLWTVTARSTAVS